jgi:hypothetical protein
MRFLSVVGLLALASVAILPAPAHAEVVVRAPYVAVRVGTPVAGSSVVDVCAPFVRVRVAVPIVPVSRAVREVPPPPVQTTPPPTEMASVAPGVPAPRTLTLAEFAAAFRPISGDHVVYLLHPYTKEPVKVAFTLPPGAPRKVKVFKHSMFFHYKKHTVSLRFFRDGSMRVRY